MAAVLKYWTGSAWTAKPLKYWTGSAWAAKTLKYWDGSAWVGPVAAVSYADNFNRANAALEASPVASGGWSWVHDGLIASAMLINVNVLRCNTTNSTGSAYKTPSVGNTDQYVQYKVGVLTSSGPFCCCRLLDRSNFIGVRNNGGDIEVYRRVAGTLTSLYNFAAAVIIGDTIRLEVSGTNWTVKKNGVMPTGGTGAIGATLTDLGTGVVARTVIGQFFDDFEAGTL